jgi:uncharacterized NAD(P)/FAD-binding protein YdhS
VEKTTQNIAILGGGPSGLFAYKQLIASGQNALEIEIFERKSVLGAGMPYSIEGAGKEHITNVSGNEIPQLVTSVSEWIETVPTAILSSYGIDPDHFNDYRVLPRLLFGQYLSAQFDLLRKQADAAGITTTLHLGTDVTDVTESRDRELFVHAKDYVGRFDHVIMCTGHHWPKTHELTIPDYFDSPYPPSKLALSRNHTVAIRGSSLTAIDAIRTLARANGIFSNDHSGKLIYTVSGQNPEFRAVIHSRSGLLPAVRFHLEDSHLSNDSLLTPDEISAHIRQNDGFLSLDFLFRKDFTEIFRDADPEFYERIKDMRIEEFVSSMMELRERLDPFTLMRAEYAEAEKSMRRHESVYWKEMLAVLSFAMNYPAKYLSAEDMQRLQKTLMPLISVVIAFVPQSSCNEMLAMHDAGILDIVAVGDDSEVTPDPGGGATYNFTDEDNHKVKRHYRTFIDCIGQPHLKYEDFPFNGLVESGAVSAAKLKFQDAQKGREAFEAGIEKVERTSSGDYYLRVQGVAINDNFQAVDAYGAYHPAMYIMAVPYIGGFNPDYSGLDFCEAASKKIAKSILG